MTLGRSIGIGFIVAAALVVLGMLTTAGAQSPTASDGTKAADLDGPCNASASIPGFGSIDPRASGGVYTVPSAGSASYTANDGGSGVDDEDRAISGSVSIALPVGSVSIKTWGDEPARRHADSGTVTWDIPDLLPGIIFTVSGSHFDPPGSELCRGSIQVKIEGNILDSPVGIASLLLTALALVGLFFAALASGGGAMAGRPFLGAIAGFLFGIFGTLDLLLLSVFPLVSLLVLILPVVFLVIGLLLGLFAPLQYLRRSKA